MAFTVAGAAQILSGIIPTLQPVVAAIEDATRSSPATIAQVQTAMTGVTNGIAALGQADSMTAAGPIVTRIETDVEAVLTIASQMQLPGPAGVALRVAAMIVPVAFMAVSMIMQQFTPAATAARRK